MSTTDPAAERAKRRERAGDRRFLAAAIVTAAFMTACAVLLGLAIATTADMLRHYSIDSAFDDREPFPTFWGLGTIGYLWTLGTAGTLIGSIGAGWCFDAYLGGERQPRILASLAACAAAVAIVADAPTWTAPLKVGIALDPVFHEDEPWSVFGWIGYYADIWLPAIAVVVAGLVVAHSIRHYGRLRRQLADRSRLLVEGRRASGMITGVAARTTVNDQGQRSTIGYVVTVRYTDAHGAEREATRFSPGRNSMPTSDTAEVLFDPRRPGDDDLVFIALHPDPDPPEWIGVPV